MKRSNRLVILVGVLLAVLAFVAIVILLNQGGDDDPESEVPTTATVLVASRDIAIGEPVTPDVVETDEILVEAVRSGALQDPSEVSGETALFAIPAGSQITEAAIGRGSDEDICIECQLNPGEKAIAFQVDRVTGVDFLVRPGDSIDVVLSQQITVLQETADSAANPDENATPRFEAVTGLENQRTVKAILQNKRVLYVSSSRAITPEPTEDTNQDGVIDENDAPAEQASVDSVVIVFAGTNQDAEVIKYAQRDLGELGSLTAVIRSSEDDAEEATLGVTIDQLVAEYGLRIPDIIEQLTEEAPAP